jgi:two-component system NtrC family sensor kinase
VPHRRPNFFWPLRLIVGASLLAPAALFAWTSWDTYHAIAAQTDERIERTLDVLQEHAQKSLQTVERAISEINEVLRGETDDQIRADEADLYLRFKRTQQALPQIESIWAFDRNGRPLVSSTILPVPPLDNSDRSYFRSQSSEDAGTFVSEVIRARVGGMRFFVVSGRRDGNEAGVFDGVIAVTVAPDHFAEFYRKLARGNDAFALVRADGALLARYPAPVREYQATSGELAAAIASHPGAGLFTGVSPVDGVTRRLGYRKVPDFPVYVTAAVATAAISGEFWSITARRLAVGVPVVLALFLLSLYALRRAEGFRAEVARRETAEAALKQAQRLEAIGQLTGGVAHDFNNLLMIVSGNAERLQKHLAGDPGARRYLSAIEMAVKRGAELTGHLLSFSRRQAHEKRLVDLTVRLPAVQAMLQSSLRGDIAIRIDVAEDTWPILIDLSELELALLNLAVNARDAMPSGGQLILAARNTSIPSLNEHGLKGDFIALSVSDTGTGIAPAIAARVFEPFFTTKEVGKGTGLGLSQVYGFARQAGGTAIVDSTLGEGTTVTLFLPRVPDSSSAADEPAAPPRSAPTASGLSVLVVEDNAEVAEVTRALLEERGHSVTVSSNVDAALDALGGQARFDIVLSDIVMPGDRDGLDLARRLREKHPELPVVLASGYSDKAQTAANEGYRLVRKPFDGGQLEEAFEEVLRRRRSG